LTAAYPPNVADHEAIWTAIQRAIHDEDGFLSAYLDHPPQTNEVARSSVLLGGCLSIAETTKLPLELIEIGSSAGLNLTFDRYRYDLGVGAWGRDDAPVRIASRWRGLPAPLSTPLMVSGRSGCDVTPLDPGSPADRARLLSYIWPDQFERLARAEAALAAASRSEVRVDKADAGDWLASRLNEADPSGRTRVVFHTIVWQYLPAATKERIKPIIHDAGGRAATVGPLAWLCMEPDAVDGSAAVRVTIWPGGKTTRLGRADYHGRWSAWGRD
jgi:hypothetical protein